jgi:hypothetical protein
MSRRASFRQSHSGGFTRAGRRADLFRKRGFKTVPGSGVVGYRHAIVAWLDFAKREKSRG